MERQVTLASLARATTYSKGHLSNVERGTRRPTTALIKACDDFLKTGGRLLRIHVEFTSAAADAPVRPLPRRPLQLPPVVTAVVGRDDELKLLDALRRPVPGSASARVTSLVGPAGIGKTTVALEWSHRHVAEFADGVLFADMHGFDHGGAPVPPEETLDHFLRELGVDRSSIPDHLDARSALFRTVCSDRELLIVLDNVATVDQVVPLVPSSNRCLVLITSRSHLSSLGVLLDVEYVTLTELDPAASNQLLENSMGSTGTDRNVLSEVADLCGHYPLALRIVGRKIASSPGLRLDQFVEQLRHEERRLQAFETGDHHASLAGAIANSVRSLSDQAQRLFRLLGVHPGPVMLGGVGDTLLGLTADVADPLLDELSQLHLLEQTGPGRYAIHDLVWLYAHHELVTSADAAVADDTSENALRWYLGQALAADTMIAPWQVRPPVEDVPAAKFENITSAFDWCDDNLDVLTAVHRSAAAASSPVSWHLPLAMAGYFKLRRPRGPWVDTHLVGLDVSRRLGATEAEGWLLNNLATAYYHVGDFDSAKRYFAESTRVRTLLGDTWGVAWCRLGLGFVLWHNGSLAEARTLFTTALPPLKEAGDLRAQGLVRIGLAATLPDTEHRRALDGLHRALADFDACDDRNGHAMALHELGSLLHRTGSFAEAERRLRQALRIREEDADTAGAAETWYALADVFSSLDRRRDEAAARRRGNSTADDFTRPRGGLY